MIRYLASRITCSKIIPFLAVLLLTSPMLYTGGAKGLLQSTCAGRDTQSTADHPEYRHCIGVHITGSAVAEATSEGPDNEEEDPYHCRAEKASIDFALQCPLHSEVGRGRASSWPLFILFSCLKVGPQAWPARCVNRWPN